jgi:hypothetical protein
MQRQYDSTTIKNAARGNWLSILSSLAGIPKTSLDGQGHPCPRCAGTDRFNSDRNTFQDNGRVHCNQKCGIGGDGFHVLQTLNGWDFPTTIQRVGKFLHCDAVSTPEQPKQKRATNQTNGTAYPGAIRRTLKRIRNRLPDGVTIADEPDNVWQYDHADGSPAGVVLRWDRSDGEKEIRPLTVSESGWISKAMPEPRPLYRLSAIIEAEKAETVYVCEGEKAADAVCSFGLVATASVGGSKAPGKTDWSPLDGKCVVIVPDNDQPGRQYAKKVAIFIQQQAATAEVLIADLSDTWPEIADKGDATDWSEHFDGQPPEWFRDQLERIAKPLDVPQGNAGSRAPSDSDDWPDLIPFDAPDLMSIDVDGLPDSIREMVQQTSEATETPPEMALMVALGAIATATMRKWDVLIDEDFRQPLNLYQCCVMPPGNRKSAIFRRMFEPAHQYQTQVRQAAESEFLRTSADHEIWERQCTDLKTRIGKADGEKSTDMRRELDQLLCNAPEVIHKPQLVSDDVTPESVCTLLSQNHERLGIASAEPEVFDLILGRYSKGPNLGMWLKGHDGDQHTENRRGRPEPIFLNSPLLTLTIMAQPEAIQTAGSHRVMRGRGMLDRFLFWYPPSPVGSRDCVSGTVDPLIERCYTGRLTALLKTEIRLDGFGHPEPILLTLNRDAHSLWKAEQIRVERRMADSEPLSTIAGWGSKYAAQVARMAANLHLMEDGHNQSVISDQFMEQAIRIGHVIESHTRAVFQAMDANPAMETARKVVRKITAENLSELSRRDVMRFDRTIDVQDAQTAVDLMVDHGYLAAKHTEKRRGRPSDRYDVNPAVFRM